MPAPLALDESSVAFADSPVLRFLFPEKRSRCGGVWGGGPRVPEAPAVGKAHWPLQDGGVPREMARGGAHLHRRLSLHSLQLMGGFSFPSLLRPVCSRCGPALPLPSTGDSWARAVTQWDRPPGTWAPSKPWNWNPVCGGKAQCSHLSHQYRGHLPGAFCWAWQTRPAAKSDLLNPRASARGLLNKTLSA